MIDTPSRDVLAAVTRAAEAIVPPAILGFARSLGDGRVWVLYSYPNSIGEYVVPARDLPDVLRPLGDVTKHADANAIKTTPLRPVEWPLPFARVSRALSIRVPDFEPATRFWAGFSNPDPLTSDELAKFEAVSLLSTSLMKTAEESAALQDRSVRFEMLDDLLTTLTGVLDTKAIVDKVSAVAQSVLPHDALSVAELMENGRRLRVHASDGLGDGSPMLVDAPDSTLATEPWEFRLVDDERAYGRYLGSPSAAAVMHAMLSVPVRVDGDLFGVMSFFSTTAGRYRPNDVAAARRVADHAALALSRLRLLEGVRWNDELRARAEKSEQEVSTLEARVRALSEELDSRMEYRPSMAADNGVPVAMSVEHHEASDELERIEQALRTANLNKSQAARLLGISRHKLYAAMRKLGLD